MKLRKFLCALLIALFVLVGLSTLANGRCWLLNMSILGKRPYEQVAA